MSKVTKTIECDHKHVACDGGNNASGHPTIYLEISDKNEIICPYCSTIFRYKNIKNN
jgi:uncharacterized Zn-finger protein